MSEIKNKFCFLQLRFIKELQEEVNITMESDILAEKYNFDWGFALFSYFKCKVSSESYFKTQE